MYTVKSLKLTLDGAEKIMQAAVAKAKVIGVPMSIAIVDEGTNLFLFTRMEGGKPHTVQIAIAKARAAASNQQPTGKIGSTGNALDDFAAIALPLIAGPDRYVTIPGGLPIFVDGQCVGGVGASGGTGAQDAEACQAGLDAIRK